jgi:hypothetical protein
MRENLARAVGVDVECRVSDHHRGLGPEGRAEGLASRHRAAPRSRVLTR